MAACRAVTALGKLNPVTKWQGKRGTGRPMVEAEDVVLYLGVGDQNWLEQFPKFEKLQILSLQKFAPEIPPISQNSVEKIAKC